MHILAQRVVRKALSEGATIDPIAHFDALAALDRAAREQQGGAVGRIELLDMPLRVGNTALRRLSWGALEWYETRAKRWFPRPMLDLSLAWAMAHSRRPAAFRAASDSPRARRAIVRWAKGLTCSFEALLEACDSLLPEPPAQPKKKQPEARPICQPVADESGSYGPMLLRLMRETGVGVDDLLWHMSFDTLLSLWDSIRAEDDAEARAAEPGAARDPQSPEVLAFVRFREASKAFMKLVTEGGGDEQ